MLDVLVIGGGPAGLSAALVLARCTRRVAVVDDQKPRNAWSRGVHNYLTRDGWPPAALMTVARDEVAALGVAVVRAHAVRAHKDRHDLFHVELDTGATLAARRLLLATGVRDLLPDLQGLRECYGVSVHHCPYCDGYDHRQSRLVAYARDAAKAVGLALALRTWSPHVTACTDGDTPDAADLDRARRNGIAVRTEPVDRLEHDDGRLARVHLRDAAPLDADALFFNTGQVQRSDLPRLLGCAFRDDGGVRTSGSQCTTVKGVYLAGDADRDVQFVIVAAAEGATAAVAINRELQDEDRGETHPSPPHA